MVDLERPDAVWLEGLPRPTRLQVMANAVQAAADMPEDARLWPVEERLELAASMVAPPGERHREDAFLLGAVGRALAVGVDSEATVEALGEAVRTWGELFRWDEASFALCELIRLLGIDERLTDVQALIPGPVRNCLGDPRTAPVSEAFLCLAVARALVQSGDSEAGLAWLDDGRAEWAAAPLHCQHSRARWEVQALAQLNRTKEARQRLGELDRRIQASGGSEPNLPLAKMAVRSAEGAESSEAVREFLALDALAEVRRLADRLPDRDQAAWLLREYRY